MSKVNRTKSVEATIFTACFSIHKRLILVQVRLILKHARPIQCMTFSTAACHFPGKHCTWKEQYTARKHSREQCCDGAV